MTKLDPDLIKAGIDLRDWCEVYLGPPERVSRGIHFYHSPLTLNDSDPSFAVYHDHWTCYSQNKVGNVFQLVMHVEGITFPEALQKVGSGSITTSLKTNRHKKKRQPIEPAKFDVSMADVEYWASSVHLVRDYLQRRNIDPVTCELASIGGMSTSWKYSIGGVIRKTHFEYVTIPVLYNRQVRGVIWRRNEDTCRTWMASNPDQVEAVRSEIERKKGTPPTEKKLMNALFGPKYYKPVGSKDNVLGADQLAYETETGRHWRKLAFVVLVESSFDYLALLSQSVIGVAVKANKNWDFKRIFQNVRMVYIVQQNDEVGERQAGEIYNALGASKDRARIIRPPEGYNDLSDLNEQGKLQQYLSSVGIEPNTM